MLFAVACDHNPEPVALQNGQGVLQGNRPSFSRERGAKINVGEQTQNDGVRLMKAGQRDGVIAHP